ncbi:metallophosphoesterase family protein [Natroniella acetigena]|uniref:metallophosphoesterase family protein n=1 Tax=Natroniella acetigena TaxID=52004 RepID=UPI00200A1280|nr:metallophosphoesterase [Natroniella acetigena]MCK8827821.1 metallophosphoesterase family protein [Natroniella acetigena]
MSNNLKLIHFSDAHIGHRQYGLKKRRDDMYMTLRRTIYDAVNSGIDFAVLGGDLFHNRNVKPKTLSDVERCLVQFNQAEIPIIGVQGNHDAKLYKDDLHWLEYLHARGKFILLEANLTGDGPIFSEHDFDEPGEASGYVEFEGVRIFGLQYLGQRIKGSLSQVAEGIKEVNRKQGEAELTILLGHFGIEGHIPGMNGGVAVNDLEPLEEIVDYLGLGHVHKKYDHDNWIFNPGSLESHNTREGQWDLGYYLVNKTSDGFSAEFQKSKRRPVFRFDFAVDQSNTPQELEREFTLRVEEEISNLRRKQKVKHFSKSNGDLRKPIIALRLEGLLQFSRSRLDIDRLKEIVMDKMGALTVRINDTTESKETASIIQELADGEDSIRNQQGQLDRNRVEKAIFYKLVGQDKRYSPKKEDVVEALSAVKRSVLADESSKAVAEMISERRRQLFPKQKEGVKDENY